MQNVKQITHTAAHNIEVASSQRAFFAHRRSHIISVKPGAKFALGIVSVCEREERVVGAGCKVLLALKFSRMVKILLRAEESLRN